MIVQQLLIVIFVVLSCGCLTQATAARNNTTPSRYELKFQNEIDNSTIIKRESQQQIFKCQVRLASVSSATNVTRARFKSNSTLVKKQQTVDIDQNDPSRIEKKWPANVALSIDWFRDEQQLVESSGSREQVVVINVELKSNSSLRNDKKNKPRIEIKNTLNGNQLKLTSRLRLSQLKVTDSGQYKCIARAKFQALILANNGIHSTSESISQNQWWQVVLFEQTLESNGTILMITNASTGVSEHEDEGKEKARNRIGKLALDTRLSLVSGGAKHNLDLANRQANNTQHANGHIRGQHRLQATDSDELANRAKLTIGQNPEGMSQRDSNERKGSSAAAKSQSMATNGSTLNQFEDDEDLFKMEPDRIEFISGGGQQQQFSNDYEDEQQQRRGPMDELADRLQYMGDELTPNRPELENNNESSPLTNNNQQRYQAPDLATGLRNKKLLDAAKTNYGAQEVNVFTMDNYFSGSLDSTRLRLAKFVHKIAPELSCYTGNGEHYKGNVSTSSDKRMCLNWLKVEKYRNNSTSRDSDDNHNYCRNPNMDPRGPWCFVQYVEELDENRREFGNFISVAPSRNNNIGPTKYIQRLCSISPCSEYLWLYIVAPPLGLLAILFCLITILVRSIRKSHYNSLFTNGKRRVLPRFKNFIMSRGRFAPKKSCGNYLDDDIFEIVDDLDWSDGQTQSLSPKSTESLKLNSSFSSSTNDAESRVIGCKLINPIFSDRAFDTPTTQSTDLLSNSGRSVTQVGPMFATLRCQIRDTFKSGQLNAKQNQANKSSTFIDHCDPATTTTNNKKQYGNADWLAPSLSNSSSYPASGSFGNADNKHAIQSIATTTTGSHLISCSTTLEDIEPFEYGEKYIKGNELPQLNASSVSIALDQQPIYEGKFSQVQLAYIKQLHESNKSDMSIGHIGTQVAACSLKPSVAIDPSFFKPSTLKVRNLNHLNILKLIGYAQFEDEIGLKQTQSCSLIYDMAQLVDLSDWLKQQSKDTMTSKEPGSNLGIKRNLTCFAKQMALAIDYLHDQGIVYKDLACRNCFLDPTKMLVKLASFNLELVVNASDNKAQNLKSMIRPKYLLDYYVIDSRPSDCQLLPLSWIPLESILFNKFNKQTDIWSFGCLIYELFSLGEVAYFGYSSKQVIDAIRSNLMPPQPLLCPNGIYKLICKCLSDIPTNRPNIKQIYEQLNLYSGQCSSFLDHYLCSLATTMHDDQSIGSSQLIEFKIAQSSSTISKSNSITKTKSYANIKNFSPLASKAQELTCAYDNLVPSGSDMMASKPEVAKIPLSRSINLGHRSISFDGKSSNQGSDGNHYDEPIIEIRYSTKK